MSHLYVSLRIDVSRKVEVSVSGSRVLVVVEVNETAHQESIAGSGVNAHEQSSDDETEDPNAEQRNHWILDSSSEVVSVGDEPVEEEVVEGCDGNNTSDLEDKTNEGNIADGVSNSSVEIMVSLGGRAVVAASEVGHS